MGLSGFDILPFRALRLAAVGDSASDSAAPPYDIIGPQEHRALLDRSPHNIVRLTLGEVPGEKEPYEARAERLEEWKAEGAFYLEERPALWVYGCDYTVPGSSARARFRGLMALGKLHEFDERVVLPHEHTFAKVVDDRLHLLEATRTHLESIFLLYEDPARRIDAILDRCSQGKPAIAVEGRPGEMHALWRVAEAATIAELRELLRAQRPIIADGHHRYTTGLSYRRRHAADAAAAWQPMVLGNLVGDGLSILATHRLVDTGGEAARALAILGEQLEPAAHGDWDFRFETRDADPVGLRVPAAVRAERRGVAASDYALLHDVIIGDWLEKGLGARQPLRVEYFKEGSGEIEALRRGDGDLLVRMRPVAPAELRAVVDGGEVFPHKTTFFYPKLWSGLLLWCLDDFAPLA